ncbi:MAG TPA: bifunctional (p)ppGpp synthetase/guanosine-3',5'-bis(diphosphate) 3'-pyrophosphohydrolase [bacterium]|nr:bifunctional (p)ppGpp synthetase/guanosine-3',5'-bis(diphosphate) 3'-pyrophosphohydrolase [bacterium]
MTDTKTTNKKNKDVRDQARGFDSSSRRRYRYQFDKMIRVITSYTQNVDIPTLKKAYQFAYEAHKDKLRLSGVPYIEHCLETAKILVDLRLDPITISAGLLHDVVEDTGITIDEVREQFGEEIALLVDGVTKISELRFESQAEKQAENFRKMIFSMARDLRVIMIKFADRLHNMRTIKFVPEKKAHRIALETREVYATLAHRFGIARVKWELEDAALSVLEPEIYLDLVKKVFDRREKREEYIRKVTEPIDRELQKHGIQAQVAGRAKNFYSIYQKMKKRNVPFEEIYDLLAIRIIVNRIDECYFVLGVVHTLFTPVHDRFKDYIATPKLNMYQSLHTTVVGPEGKMVEIQVRTEEMHHVAEIGIAAHWKYKEGRHSDDELDRYSGWLREMVDWQKDMLDPEEYLDILKTDLFISEVFVFTPKGDLLKMPIGSTPVDFAFAVHTDIGFQCIGAKVNGSIVPLNTELKSGDSVEIITSANQKPNRDWITFVKTSKAKSKIRRWLKEAQFQEAVKLGEEMLNKGLKRYNLKITKKEIADYAKATGIKMERLLAELGAGDLSLHKVLKSLAPDVFSQPIEKGRQNIFERFVFKARGAAHGIRVQGMDNLLIRFARCCHPVPGDSIVGYLTQGKGIVVHRRDCTNVKKLMEVPERNVDVEWAVDGEEAFMVQLQIMAVSRGDFLKDVGETLSNTEANILKVNLKTENAVITAYMIIEVKDLTHLTRIIRKIYRLKGILSVERVNDFTNSDFQN